MKDRQAAAETAIHDQTNLLPKRELLIVFSALSISLFICFVDQNGVGVALPTIARDLNAQSTVSWAGTSALIANTVFQVLYGRLSDIFGTTTKIHFVLPAINLPTRTGRKVIFLSALALLSVSALLCGLSVNSTMLYICRGLAGVADGGITSLTMMIVSDTVSLKERGKYQGILGACVGAGNMIGPFIAAAFVERSTWRGLFWLVCPLAAVCAGVCFWILPDNMPKTRFRESARNIDHWGVLTGSAAIILILVPVSGGGTYYEWGSPMVISMLAIGGICGMGFFYVEYKIAVLPMMPRESRFTYRGQRQRFLLRDELTSPSFHVQEFTCVCLVAPEYPFWNSLLQSALLPPSVLPERPAALAYRLCRPHPPNTIRPNDLLHRLRSIHFPPRAIW